MPLFLEEKPLRFFLNFSRSGVPLALRKSRKIRKKMIKLDSANQRKSKKENRVRTVDWHLRLTDEEAAELGKLVFLSGKNRRDYILDLARHGVVIDMTPVVKELYKQGVNLNQVAHKLNMGASPDKEILETIKEVQAEWQLLKYAISVLLKVR